MFAQKLQVEIELDGEKKPCPLEWLDSFAMRNFTRSAEFDDTLPTGAGHLEAGLNIDPKRLAAALEEWFNGRGMGHGKTVRVEVSAG
ncbi:MAG TPA: hypothetical protein VEJ39_09135 [Candidatus Acidoferrales bacterium]|nr:hypothetical protein [Candidatus Acidoferrales bacterium]